MSESTESATADDVRVPIRLVYVGRRETTKKKVGYFWVALKLGQTKCNENALRLDLYDTSVRHIYDGKTNIYPAEPGTIIDIDSDGKGSVFRNSAKLAGVWENSEEIAEWRIQDRVMGDMFTARSAAKKQLKESLPLERLEPFRNAYLKANRRERPFLLAFVIEAVTSEMGLRK